MANFSDGPSIPMPDFSSHSNDYASSAADMKYHLQNLLDSKEKQLQQAGTLGQRVLAQQMELEERIRQLQEADADKGEDDALDEEATARYRELAETIQTWDRENAELSGAFGNKVRTYFYSYGRLRRGRGVGGYRVASHTYTREGLITHFHYIPP